MIDEALDQWLQGQLGTTLRRRSAVGGGCIHQAWCLELADGRRVFLKANRADALPLLQAEAEGLAALALLAPPQLQVPQPLGCALLADQALLLLPWLELGGPGDRQTSERSWHAAGGQLAQLHRHSLGVGPGQGCFGWSTDNFIGSNRQPNGWELNWGTFFAEQRLGFQLQLAAAGGLNFSGAERLLERVPGWLKSHLAEPVIVHGDLWSGNASLLAEGGATIFDPAVYRGDREVDLAMAQLFGGFPDAFFAGYSTSWPLLPGAAQRRQLYNLYHLLNHANLFGGAYIRQAQSCINTLLGQRWA